ncbi:hypothetical protein GKE82_25050 [Conexibacter sp. W3-3-2]|uniref:hypothetical protein n=1 Tax=Conexibacter sp. W3-3-2 TaxID=2675227 RepID=UPI0012B7F9B0|nr:hypothetical protein [Conexibacter sp. W3-3-2]MTD47474.1 hypothetical protein [Conexibacter sp. W3-3-2]
MATATAAACLAASIAFFIGAGSDPTATANNVRSGETLLRSQFAVFGTASEASEPGNLLTPERLGRLALKDASIQRLAVPVGVVWVGADDERICIAAQLNTTAADRGACVRTAQALDTGVYTLGQDRGTSQAEVAALIPDGVTAVTFVLANGDRQAAEVTDNGVFATLPALPERVTFQDRDGAQRSVRL